MNKEVTETSNVDSDDDVIFVETKPVDIEVITLSDDETQETYTSSTNTFSTSRIPSFPVVNQIKREINSAVVSTPIAPPLRYISSSQRFFQNPLANVFEILEKVRINSQKFKRHNRGTKQIGKLLSNSESNNNLQRGSENKNKAVSNESEVNNIPIEKQTTHISSNDLQENSSNQSIDIVNRLSAEASSVIEKTELNIDTSTVIEHNTLQDSSNNRDVVGVNESQSGPSSDVEKTELNVESLNAMEDNDLQDDLSNQNTVVNEPRFGSSSNPENTRTTLPYTSIEVPLESKRNDVLEMNRDENSQAQQCTTNNAFHKQRTSNSMQDKLISFKNTIFNRAEYFDPLLSVIVEEGYPEVRYLTEYHLFIVRRLVGFELDNVLATGTFVPKFERSYAKSGVILVRSADAESQNWLQSIIPLLNPGAGVKLTTVSPQELNRMYKIKILIFYDTNKKQILTRIQKQNPDINMKSWQLQSVQYLKDDRHGVIMHMAIPAYSVKFLENRNFKLHYGLYQVDVEMKDVSYEKKC